MAELKPCPFCGSKKIKVDDIRDGDEFFVWCKDCGASGPEYCFKQSAIDAWNKRS